MAKITLIGMYNYDQTLFDLLTLPTGIDKNTLIDNILIRSGEFEVLYPDMDYLKFSIGAWSRKWRPTFDRWQKALEIEYDPLDNYNRIEEWSEIGNKKGSESSDASGSETEGHAESRSDSISGNDTENTSGSTTNKELQVGSSSGSTSGTTSSTTDTDKSAYDSATLVNVEELRVSGADASSNTAATSMSISGLKLDSVVVSRIKSELQSGTTSIDISKAHTEKLKKALEEMNNLKHLGRIHGNIGVTTSQQMLKSELDLGYWNIYEKITDLFLTEFVIPIY